MGLLNSDDLAMMKADVAAIIDDDETSIAIKRASGAADDPGAQDVRLVGLAQRPIQRTTIGGDVVMISLLAVGETDLDIERGDKFQVSSQWYEVIELRPGEDIKVVAECKLVT